MNKLVTFENSSWLIWIIIASVLTWLVFIWKEKHHYPSFKFFANSIIALITICALALLILKPLKYASTKPFKAAIITSNFKQKQLDSLKNKYKNIMIYRYDPEHRLLENTSVPEELFILGDGIKEYDLWQLDSINTNYLGGNIPKGIINIKYKTHNKIGKQAIFKGRYQNASKGYKLVLETSDGKTLDSLQLNGSEIENFKLKTTLKAEGNFLFYLAEKDSLGKTINQEPLPITISGDNNLRILILNGFPTFETKYLKNYLVELGHEVVVKSQLTRDRFKYEYFNNVEKLSSELTQKNLELFDLLIIDNAILNKFSKTIKKVVTNNGLGVFIQPDVSFFSSKNNFAKFKFISDRLSSVKLESQQKNINTFLYNFKNETTLQVIDSSKNKIISAYKQMGLGKVSTAMLKNSYELLLNGNGSSYRSLWANIIEKTSKKNLITSQWKSKSLFAFKDEPFLFSLATQTKKPSVTNRDLTQLSLKQNINIPTLWEGKTNPYKSGWQRLQIKQDTNAIFNYYVIDNSKWQSLQSNKIIEVNKRAFHNQQKLKKGDLKSAEPINLTWLFLIFIFGIGWLWLEAKL